MVICRIHCGCYLEAIAVGLAKRCTSHTMQLGRARGPSKGAQYRLGRFLRGLHPAKVGVTLDGPYLALPSEAILCTEDSCKVLR